MWTEEGGKGGKGGGGEQRGWVSVEDGLECRRSEGEKARREGWQQEKRQRCVCISEDGGSGGGIANGRLAGTDEA